MESHKKLKLENSNCYSYSKNYSIFSLKEDGIQIVQLYYNTKYNDRNNISQFIIFNINDKSDSSPSYIDANKKMNIMNMLVIHYWK